MEKNKRWWQVLLGGLVMALSLVGVARGREKEEPQELVDPHDQMYENWGQIGNVADHHSLSREEP